MKSDNKPNKGFGEFSEEEIQNSTVFSKPQIVDKKVKKKKKKNLRIILTCAAVPVLITAIVFAVIFLKDNVLPEEPSSVSSSENEHIKVTENPSSNVKSVVLENENGKFEFYSVSSLVNSEGDEKADDLWYLRDIDKEYTDTEFTGLTVRDCATFLANEKYSDKNIDFSDPSVKIKVDLIEGEDYEITFSGILGEGSNIGGAYAKVSGVDGVYFIKSDMVEYFTRDKKYYIDYVAPTAIDKNEDNADYFGEGLERFDYIEISGKDVKHDYRFEMYEKDGTTKYKMVSPYEVKVKTATVANLVSLLKNNLDNSGIQGIIYYDSNGLDEKILKKFGLDEPSAVIRYKVGKDEKVIKLQDIKVADPKTENYEYSMIVEGVPVVYEVSKNSFDYFGYEISEFATDAMVEEDISEIKSLNVSLNSKDYGFKLSQKPFIDEETEEEKTQLTVKYDGKIIDGKNFVKFYGFITSVKPFLSSLTFERPKNASEYFTITIENVDGDLPKTELSVFSLKGSKSRYYLELDGVPVGLTAKESIEKITDNVLNVINNVEIV